MSRLSIRLAFAIAALAFTGIGFSNTTKKAATPASISTPSAASLKPNQAKFYWYSYPDDFYFDYRTTSDESYELWMYYGVPVNTTPGGGMLVARGYPNGVNPHNMLPMQFLYAHY